MSLGVWSPGPSGVNSLLLPVSVSLWCRSGDCASETAIDRLGQDEDSGDSPSETGIDWLGQAEDRMSPPLPPLGATNLIDPLAIALGTTAFGTLGTTTLGIALGETYPVVFQAPHPDDSEEVDGDLREP